MAPHYMGFLIRKAGRQEKMVEVNGEQGRRHWGGEWERDIGILGYWGWLPLRGLWPYCITVLLIY
jgi:hypothetical protein